jgi:hypothetical protein
MSQLWPTFRRSKNCLGDLCCISILGLVLNALLFAQQPGQKTFASPEDASQALYAAVQTGDQTAIFDTFGPVAKEIIPTGDSVHDQNERDRFVTRYKEMHHLDQEPDGSTTLYIGAYNRPFPVPLVHETGAWHFDTETGAKEIAHRRIVDNELDAIDMCYELVNAEYEYYSQPWDGRVQQYAQALASEEGQHNGLFWQPVANEPESPIGPLVAGAAGVGDGNPQAEQSSPFHGYYYLILTGQAGAAPGGAKSYIENGAMSGGFAILAYPADHGSSGVRTFIVNQTGVIYQKDLGAETTKLANAMKEYAPDETWRRTD